MIKQLVGMVGLLAPCLVAAVPYGYGDGIPFNMNTKNPISLGSGNDLFLGYRFGVLSTDNVARAQGDLSTGSLIYRAGLDAGFRRDTGKNLYWAGVGVTTALHERTSQADYTDAKVLAAASINRGGLHRLRFEAATVVGHDALGEERVTGADDSNVDRWLHSKGRANYHFGRPSTPLSLNFFVEGAERDYLNNQAETRLLDYNRVDAGLIFSAAYSSKTHFIVGARVGEVSYAEQASAANRDSDLLQYFAGVRWLATAKTSGEIRLGRISREITSSGREQNDFAWQALVDWKPKTYSSFRLATDVSYDESVFSQASYIRNRALTLSWKHKWATRWSSNVFTRYRESSYVGLPGGRVDDVYQLGGSLTYDIGNKATLSPRIDYAKKDSTVTAVDYTRWDFGLQLEVSF